MTATETKAVAENLNFARAADQLHVTQPAVTQQIHALEKELNVRLFLRTTRTVKMTEAGEVFYNDAAQMVAISQRAKWRFENAGDEKMQFLSLGCYNFPCMFLLADVFKDMAKAFPALHPRLQVIPFQHIYRLLEEGGLDGVVGFKEPEDLKVKASYKEVAKVSMVCICPEDHPFAARESVALEAFKGEKLVIFAPAKASVPLAHIHGQLMGGRAPSEFYFCESGEAITVLVNAGFGVSILPDLAIPKGLGIVRVPVEGLEPVSFGVYYKSLQGKPLLKAFIKGLKENFSGLE